MCAFVKTHRSGHMRPTCFTICKLYPSRKRFHDSCANEKKTNENCLYFFSRNLIADIFGESGDEEEEEFTVSIRWKYFLFVYIFCLFVFMAVVLY